jgi:hypothetical protein
VLAWPIADALGLLRFDQERIVRVGRHPVPPARSIDLLSISMAWARTSASSSYRDSTVIM